ncbi:MAG: ARMT1-like domain-containing protein [Kosmotogaceae bacterium]
MPCNINTAIRIMKDVKMDDSLQLRILNRLLNKLQKLELTDITPVHLGKEAGDLLREYLKDNINREKNEFAIDYMLKKYSFFENIVKDSKEPLESAIRLAVAGNIIDIAPGHSINIEKTVERVLNASFDIDNITRLSNDLKEAKTLLYVGDNCGETVLDKLLIETANVENVFYAVRSKPVLNDVTYETAVRSGLNNCATIIDSGSDAPGVIEDLMSDRFRQLLQDSDVVIAKGQGNFESMSGFDTPIYFLLMAKCNVIANYLGVEKGSFIVKKTENRDRKTTKDEKPRVREPEKKD